MLAHESVLRRLTLEEKCSLLSGADFWNTTAIPRAGIPALKMSDGPHGLRMQGGSVDNLNQNKSVPATCFPTAVALASSWDPALAEAVGAAIGREAAAQGVGMLLGPGLCLKRDPLCGRNFEYFSEDPLLSGRMAAAMVRGVQSTGIAACIKHFAVNNQETNRLTVDAVVDERTLRELYLAGFETAVREGKPLAVMSAYNRINGVYANENRWLLTDVLRGDWGFSGAVVTDWGAGNERVKQLLAGGNLEMPGTRGETDREVYEAVRAGKLDEATLDESVDELLRVVFAVQDGLDNAAPADLPAHHTLARRAAAESMVLLKNEGDLLPLAGGARVAVIGDFARKPRYQGAGSSIVNPTRLDDDRELAAAGLDVVGYAAGYRRSGQRSRRLLLEAVALARRADTVLLYIGLDEFSEVEGLDRTHLRLPENQLALLDAVADANPNVVVLLASGAPVEMAWAPRAKAILHCLLGGQAVAGAVADIVTGRVNPSGRLSESYPFRYEDTPTHAYFPGGGVTGEYREGLFVGYRYYLTADAPVQYPFGFGLSYTTFALADPAFSDGALTLTVTNTGRRDGATVVEVYVEPRTQGTFRPKRTLAGFCKVFLEAGESRAVSIPVPDRAFQFWSAERGAWVTEAGEYAVLAGASCEDTPLGVSVLRAGDAPVPCPDALACYRAADVLDVSNEAFAALLGRPIPPDRIEESAPVTMNDTVASGGRRRGFGRFLRGLLRLVQRVCTGLGLRSDAVSVAVALQMPYRALWRATNGMFSREMLDGFVTMADGRFFAGLRGLFRGLGRKKRIGKLTDPGREREI